MVEKMRAEIERGVYYSFTKEEAIAIYKHLGVYELMSTLQKRNINTTIMFPRQDKIPQIEETIRKAGLTILDPESN